MCVETESREMIGCELRRRYSNLVMKILLVAITLSLLVWRCTAIIYIIFCMPILLTFLYFAFKNDTSLSSGNKDRFFESLRFGGHRGSPVKAPENTLESMQKAKNEGCDVVEFDIHMSNDGVALLMHDDSTERTGDTNLVVRKTDWKDLKDVKLKTVNKIEAQIPKLSDIVAWCIENKIKMIFDVKEYNVDLLEIVAKEIGKNNIYHQVLVSSFSPKVAWRLKKIDPKVVTAITMHRTYYSFQDDFRKNPFSTNLFFHWWNQILDEINVMFAPTYLLPKFLGVDVLMSCYKMMSEDAVDEARERGFSVIAWTVNSADFMRIMRKWGVPFLTDVPSEVDELLLKSSSSRDIQLTMNKSKNE